MHDKNVTVLYRGYQRGNTKYNLCLFPGSLTIQCLQLVDIVVAKLDVRDITFVPRVHGGFSHIGMLQTQIVSKFMKRRPVQVDAAACVDGECFIVIKMDFSWKT